MKIMQNNDGTVDKNEMYFNIKQVANIIDVVPATIRNWEKAGLFVAKRKGNNYRVFDFNDIELLRKIKTYSTEENMNMALIKKMLVSESQVPNPAKKRYQKEIYHTKLKEYREKNGYTLEDVSHLTGISASYISRIEQGQGSVSLDILQKLTNLYGESIFTFFGMAKDEAFVVFRDGEGAPLENMLQGVETSSLDATNSSAFKTIIFTAAAGHGDFISHAHPSGQEFIYVLSGKLQVTLNDKDVFLLKNGDSIHFDSTLMHNWHNAGKTTLKMLWIHASL